MFGLNYQSITLCLNTCISTILIADGNKITLLSELFLSESPRLVHPLSNTWKYLHVSHNDNFPSNILVGSHLAFKASRKYYSQHKRVSFSSPLQRLWRWYLSILHIDSTNFIFFKNLCTNMSCILYSNFNDRNGLVVLWFVNLPPFHDSPVPTLPIISRAWLPVEVFRSGIH